MTNPRLATRYAKSLIDIATEQNQLENTYQDMVTMQTICKGNKDFVQLLKSPIVKPETKKKIVTAISGDKVGVLVNAFNTLLITKGRESNLPEIANAFIQQYKNYKGIKTVKITTASELGEETKNAIVRKMYSDTNTNIELEAVVDANIIGGFILQAGDNLIDGSIAYDLKAIQKQFLNNDFIYKVR
jgi:F-type H+-transporting ATPase subunit delta